ncbi:MAG: winged helix-turn-helix transcriptional regulator [Alphaproteobacteria bacterium]|jgi:DNA-binding MarR family transcriptional regulator|nr:winged helix-turn-helix transcriptional regulator [Alphaproteobacteria bacterium]
MPPRKPPDTPRPGDKRYQIVTYIGIADQLLTTAANRVLAGDDLPLAQFVMLQHFSHEPELGRSVTQVADAFQVPQPGVTKMLQRLVKKGFLAVRAGAGDGRVKLHFLTPAGLDAHRAGVERLTPAVARVFADWAPEDIDRLHGLLFRLKTWLDRDRDGEDQIQPKAGTGRARSGPS